jgi:tetratricopeptide (TPR) repeat protein
MPGNEQIYQQAMNQGHSAGWDQQWESAIEFYKQAVEEMPERVQAYTSLGLAYYELRRYEEARECYTRAIKLSPEDPLPVEKIAQIYERTGRLTEAAEMAMNAAELHLRLHDIEKAVENWTRVVNLVPEHLKAHSRLALVYERLGKKKAAIQEFISTAALLQEIGQIEDAINAVKKAVAIDPEDAEAIKAFEMVSNNQTLPKAGRKRGVTSALRMAAVREMQETSPVQDEPEQPDPIEEAKQKALTMLAAMLFDVNSEEIDKEDTAPRGIRGLFGGGGNRDVANISKQLGIAIDLQTRGDEAEAVKELKKAIDSGLNSTAAFFNLGSLYFNLGRQENAQRNLQHAVADPDFAIASRLMVGKYLQERSLMKEASTEFLEALKMADMAVVSPETAEGLRSQYELLIETYLQGTDEKELSLLCDNISELLIRPNWRRYLKEARAQLPGSATGSLAMPLAEILVLSNSNEMMQAITKINQIARKGYFRAAMDEAYYLMRIAPAYLPLHILMGELLLRQNRLRAAINKFTIVADTYASRGEDNRASDLLQKIVEIAPLDLPSRNRLIQHHIDQNQIDDAINEYLNLADVHYRLTQLDAARSTFEKALRLTQQPGVDRAWGTRIYHQMADIDMQRLDWRKALRVYEQLRTLDPNDVEAQKHLVELNLRLGHADQAAAELDNFLNYLSSSSKDDQAIAFLEELAEEEPKETFIQRRLAEHYQQAAMADKAVAQWDKVAEIMFDSGDLEGAKQAIRAILVINPPNSEKYRAVLQRLG